MEKDTDDFGCLIILLCILFPEVVPFVLVLYVFRTFGK